MKKGIFFFGAMITCLGVTYSQSVAINTTGAIANNSAMLDVTSTTKGILVPRMSTAQRNGIAAPATGLLVYDTNFQAFWYFDGTIWRPFLSDNTGWTTTGNAGTVNGTNFMGSTDNVSVDFRTNNTIRATLMNTGEFRIVGAGSVGSPIYSWTGDPNTGLYSIAADNLGFTVGGVEKLRMTTTSAVFNEQSNDYDFRIESNNQANQFFVNGATDQVNIRMQNHPLGYTDPFGTWVTDNATIPFAVNGWNQGTTGGASTMQITNAANAYNALEATTTGTGAGAFIWRNNTGNNQRALLVQNSAGNNNYGVYDNDNTVALNYFVISDRNLKRDIKTMDAGLNEVMQLKPVNYYFDNKTYPSFGTSNDLQYGFLTQDVAKIFPSLVNENSIMDPNQIPEDPSRTDWTQVETPFSAMNYIGLIPVLTKAIQEQQQMIESLNVRIKELENNQK